MNIGEDYAYLYLAMPHSSNSNLETASYNYVQGSYDMCSLPSYSKDPSVDAERYDTLSKNLIEECKEDKECY